MFSLLSVLDSCTIYGSYANQLNQRHLPNTQHELSITTFAEVNQAFLGELKLDQVDIAIGNEFRVVKLSVADSTDDEVFGPKPLELRIPRQLIVS